MSFSGGGVGGAAEALTYMIKAYDMATPVFRAFGAEVEATTRKVQASLEQLNRAQMKTTEAATKSAAAQSDASKKAAIASERQATAAKVAADKQMKAATETEMAFGRSGSAITRFGRDTLVAAAAVSAGSLLMATRFQANTLRMQTQAGATTKELAKIRQGLLDMAGQVGVTPNQLANGMYHIVSSMDKVLPAVGRVNQELKIMKIAAEGAQVGHSNLEETTYALASAMNALHLNAKSASQVMGELNAIVGSGDMNMSDLINSFKSGIIPAAKEFGISLQSVGAALAVMGDMGMRGALSGTRLRMAISLLAAPTKQAAKILETLGMSSHQALSTTDSMSKALAQAGISVTTLSNDLRKPDGLKVALEDLNNHLRSGGLSADAASAAIDRAFGGGRMGATIKLLAENTDRLGIKFHQIGQSAGQFGTDWTRTSKTFRVEVDRAVASVEALGIKLGNDLLPVAEKGLHDLESMANWLAKNKTVLDALGGAIITFSTVAIGSYFFSKLKGAMSLMKDFGGSVGGMGRYMLGLNSAGTTAAAAGGGSIAGGGGAMGGVWGITGTQIRVGTRMNPMAVMVLGSSGPGGIASSTGGGSDPATKAATASNAAAAEERQLAKDLKAGGASLDARIAAMETGVGTGADSRIEAFRTPAGRLKNPISGAFMSAEQASIFAESQIPAGVISVREALAAEAAAIDAQTAQVAQVMYHVTPTTNLRSIAKRGLDPTAPSLNAGEVGDPMGTYMFKQQAQVKEWQAFWKDQAKLAGMPEIGRLTPLRVMVPPGHPLNPDLGMAQESHGVYTNEPIGPGNLSVMGSPAQEQRIMQAQKAEAQMAAARMAQITQDESLFAKSALKMEENLAIMGEQLSFGGIGTGRAPAAMTRTLTAEEAAMRAGLISAMPAEGAAARLGLTGGLKSIGHGLMRGGMIAGLGVLGAQTAGSMIGGSTGATVSAVGTGAAVGAGIGSMAGPIGTAVGGLLGGAVSAAIHFLGAKDYGKELTGALTHDIPKATKQHVAAALDAAHAITEARAIVGRAGRVGVGGATETRLSRGSHGTDVVTKVAPLSPEEIQKQRADFEKAGSLIAGALQKGWSKFKFQDVPTMFKDLTTNLDKMPRQVQATAIESALAYARGLEKNKKLPAGATAELLNAMKVQYPGFEKYVGLSAQADVAAFTKHFDFTRAEKSLSTTMTKMSLDFPPVQQAMNNTTGDAQAKAKAMITALQSIVDTGTKPMRQRALADIAALRKGAGEDFIQLTQLAGTNTAQLAALTTTHFKNMHQRVAAETKAMAGTVSSNSAEAFQVGTANFKGLAQNIAAAIGAGAEATSKGLQNITDQVNHALKGFGEKPMSSATVKALSPGQLAAVITGQVSSGAAESPHATGGKVDSRTYMVGEEGPAHPEYVLATNPAYRPRNVALWAQYAKEIGIPGFAAGGKTGIAGALRGGNQGVAVGGQYVFPFPKGEPFTWARIDQGQDLQGPPGGPVLAIAPGVVSKASDSFSGFGPFYPTEQITAGALKGKGVYYGHTKIARTGLVAPGDVIAHTQSTANEWTAAPAGWLELGLLPYGGMTAGAAIAPLLHALASGHMVPGIGSSQAIPQIIAPKVKGLGGIGQVAQGALNRVVKAANAALVKQAMRAMGGTGIPTFGAGSWQAELQKISKAKGWNANDWLWIVAAEAGTPGVLGTGNPNIMNSIGAFGLGQFIPANYGKFGPGSDPHQHPTGVQEIDSMGEYIAGRYTNPTAAKAYHLAHNSYKRGGKVKFAGAFADGGMFTAHGPTIGLFGEGGRAEDVYAIPRQTGGVMGMTPDDRTSYHSHTGPHGTSHSTTHSTSTVDGGTKTTTTTTTGTTSTGKPTSSTTVTTSPVTPKATKKIHYTTAFNPLTDQVESHTASEWQKIHAEHAKQTHDAAAAKKKYDAYLAQQVQTTFTVGGQAVGAFDESRKLQQGQFGDVIKKGKVDIMGDLSHLTVTAWKKVISTITAGIGAMPLDQQMSMATKLTSNVSKQEAPLLRQEHGIHSEINKLSKDANRRTTQAERLHKEALTEHGKQRKKTLQVAHRDQVVARTDRHRIGTLDRKLTSIGDEIAKSRPAQLANVAITAAARGATDQFTAHQTQFDKTTSIVGLLAGIRPGTSLKTLGLTPTMLKSAGLTPATARHLIGAGTDSKAYATEIQSLTAKQIPEYQADARRLQTLYNQSLKTHNKKLQASLLSQLDTVTQATLKAYGDLQTAQVNMVESTFTKAQTDVGKLQGGVDIMGAITGMKPGTNLAAMGLGQYAGLTEFEGNARPMQAAGYTNTILGHERSIDIDALNALKDSLPSLSGPALDTANTHILDLSKSILDLTNQINSNLIKAIQDTAKTFSDISDLSKGGNDLLGQIENFAPGTSLGAMGLTPDVLKTLGLNPDQATSLEGTGMDYLGNLITNQGGIPTPAQIAAAGRGVGAINSGLRAQETPLINELQFYQGQLPNLQGQDRTDVINIMVGLASAIAGLEKTMGDNNDALAKLTTATNANTTATGQMTGTVAYQYQGQTYTGHLSSEVPVNLGVGG